MLLPGRVDPGIDRFGTRSHPCIVGMVDGEASADLFRGPAPPQVRDHPVNERVMRHQVGLMRSCSARVGVELCLASEIEAVVPVTGVKFVPQVRAKIDVVVFGLPRTFRDLAADG